jgi:hypothetical protein
LVPFYAATRPHISPPLTRISALSSAIPRFSHCSRVALRFVERPSRGIEQQRIVRRVDLDVGRAEAHQLLDLVAQDRDHVGEEGVERGVGAARAVRRPEVREQAGARQVDLSDAAGPPA